MCFDGEPQVEFEIFFQWYLHIVSYFMLVLCFIGNTVYKIAYAKLIEHVGPDGKVFCFENVIDGSVIIEIQFIVLGRTLLVFVGYCVERGKEIVNKSIDKIGWAIWLKWFNDLSGGNAVRHNVTMRVGVCTCLAIGMGCIKAHSLDKEADSK